MAAAAGRRGPLLDRYRLSVNLAAIPYSTHNGRCYRRAFREIFGLHHRRVDILIRPIIQSVGRAIYVQKESTCRAPRLARIVPIAIGAMLVDQCAAPCIGHSQSR